MIEKSIREVKQSYECPSASGGHLRETQGNIKAAKCEDLTARALIPPRWKGRYSHSRYSDIPGGFLDEEDMEQRLEA